MPDIPLHYVTGIQVGDSVLITRRQRVYHKIYPTGVMAFDFGITYFNDYNNTVGIVMEIGRESYIGRSYETFRFAGINYVFPPWLVRKINRKPEWEV